MPHAEYVVWEPLPNDLTQKTGDVRIMRSEGIDEVRRLFIMVNSGDIPTWSTYGHFNWQYLDEYRIAYEILYSR